MAINIEILINKDITLLSALKRMDEVQRKLLILMDEDKFVGLISIGDIQRALINKTDLNDLAINFVRSDILYGHKEDDFNNIKKMMLNERMECMPIVDDNNNLIDIIEWKDVFAENTIQFANIDLPVVIMAGGMGSRLRPITNIIPKPLIPISNDTIIEVIMNRFQSVGCNKFYISVNYKSEIIKEYLSKLKRYNMTFIQENRPLGTAGSLYLLREALNKTFFLSNCDILLDLDYSNLLSYHKGKGNVITIVSVIKNYSIPYGTLETGKDGQLLNLKEKPDLLYQINSGMYVLEPEVFNYIEKDEFIHITDLVLRIKKAGKKIGVFPVSEGAWVDMGNWDDYLKLIER